MKKIKKASWKSKKQYWNIFQLYTFCPINIQKGQFDLLSLTVSGSLESVITETEILFECCVSPDFHCNGAAFKGDDSM